MKLDNFVTKTFGKCKFLGISGLEADLYFFMHDVSEPKQITSRDGAEHRTRRVFSSPQNEIADVLGITPRGLLKIFNRLEEKGLVQREQVETRGYSYVRYIITDFDDVAYRNWMGEQSSPVHQSEQSSCSTRTKFTPLYNNTNYIPSVDTKVSTPGIGGISEKTTEITETTEIKQPKRKNTIHTWKKNVQQEVIKRGFTTEITQLIKLWIQQLLETGTRLPISTIEIQLDMLLNYTEEQQISILKKLTTKGWKHIDTTIEVMEKDGSLTQGEDKFIQVNLTEINMDEEDTF